jgi:hypothetical protein
MKAEGRRGVVFEIRADFAVSLGKQGGGMIAVDINPPIETIWGNFCHLLKPHTCNEEMLRVPLDREACPLTDKRTPAIGADYKTGTYFLTVSILLDYDGRHRSRFYLSHLGTPVHGCSGVCGGSEEHFLHDGMIKSKGWELWRGSSDKVPLFDRERTSRKVQPL